MSDVIPCFPNGVVMTGDAVEDKCMGQTYPMNASAASFLSLVDGARTLTNICESLAERYQRPLPEILQDMRELCQQLSIAHLLNLKMRWLDKIRWWMFCLVTFTLPAQQPYRYDAPPATTNVLLLLVWVYWIVGRVLGPVFLFMSVLTVVVLDFRLDLALPGLAGEWLVFVMIVASIGLHEAGHLVTVRWKLGKDMGCIVRIGLLLKVLRPPLVDVKSEMLVSLSGPVVPVGIAVLMALISLVSGGGFDRLFGMIVGGSDLYGACLNWIIIAVFAVHALQLVLPNQDLRNILAVAQKTRK
jgi:hypothetical protein